MFAWLRRNKSTPNAASQEAEAPALPDGGWETLFGPLGPRYSDKPTGIQTVVIVGGALAETLVAGLSTSAVLTDGFRFAAVPADVAATVNQAARDLLAHASFVFLPGSAARQRSDIKALTHIDAEIVVYPDVPLRSPWPFDAQSGYADPAIIDTPTAVMRHPDGVLARLRTVEPDKEKRFELYRDLAFDEARTIVKVAAAQELVLEQLDIDTEAGLGRFMLGAMKQEPLYYDSTHPSAAVLQVLAAFVWRKLDMAGRPPNFGGMDRWKSESLPVHPGVARQLGLTWATAATRYQYSTLGTVTWEQWARAYIDLLG